MLLKIRPFIKFCIVIGISMVLAALLTIGVVLVLGFQSVKSPKISIPEDKNVIVIGNSMPESAFNDTILSNWKNLARSSAFFNEITDALDIALTQNQHVDTVIFGLSPISVIRFPDFRYYHRDMPEISIFIHNIFLDRSLVFDNLKNPHFINYLLKNAVDDICFKQPEWLGKYLYRYGHELQLHREILDYQKRKNLVLLECNPTDFKIQFSAIDNIIDVCDRHNVTLIFIDTPQYNSHEFFGDEYYKQYLSKFDLNLPVADFNDFKFPDTLYYSDVTHLNHIGAYYLSEHIKTHGLKTIPLSEYINK